LSFAKTGCDAAVSDTVDSDAAGSDAAGSDAAGSDAAEPGERSPPAPDVALRNPRNSLVPANVVDDFAFLLLMLLLLLLFFVVFAVGLFFLSRD